MSHGLLELYLEAIVVIDSIVDGHLSTAHELIENGPRAAGWTGARTGVCGSCIRNWPNISLRGQRGINHIDVVRLEAHVPSARSHVSDHQAGARGDLPLDIEVPLHYVIPPRVELHNVIAAALAVLRLAVRA